MLEHSGDPQGIRDAIMGRVKFASEVLPHLDLVATVFSAEEVRAMITRVLHEEDPRAYLQYFDVVRRYLPDEVLRSILFDLHRKFPWIFYINARHFESLFPNEYFRRLLDSGVDFLADPYLFKVFLLFNADSSLDSFSDPLKGRLLCMLDGTDVTDTRVLTSREPGFACGGMETNYTVAASQGKGLCLVNGVLLAKLFHRKEEVDARKVSFLPVRSVLTAGGQALWRDFLYAPSEGAHEAIAEAIEGGGRELAIPVLAVKPVRPMINAGSEAIYELFRQKGSL